MMKKGVVFFTILLVFSFLFASIAPAGPVMEKILKNGILRVGTSGSQPPMTATTRKGALIGMDIDIAKLIAAGLGVKVNFVTMPFSKLLPALKAGEVDMVISGMTITQERNRSLAFVGPYYVSGKGILAVAEKYAALQEASGLDTPEVTAAALKDSTSKKFIETLMPRAKMMTADTYDQAIDLLLKGEIDVFVADLPYCALTAYRFSEKGLIAGKSPLNFEPLGIAMGEDTLLINWVRNFMIRLQGTGLLTELQKNWFEGGPWVEQLP